MGKTGGHKKKSSKTGTQKKVLKQSAKENLKGSSTREAARQEYEKLLSPEATKFLEQFTTGEGQLQSIKNAQQLLNPILQGQHQQALTNFDRSTLPQLQAQHGGNRGSSAFNQALTASRMDLDKHLFDRTQELSLNYGSQLAAQQQNAGQQLYQNRLNTANAASQAGLQQGNLSATTDQSIYMPKGTPLAAQLALAGAEGAGRAGAAAATGGTSEVALGAGKIATNVANVSGNNNLR